MAANGSTTFNVKASVSDNPIRWLVAGGGLLIAAIAIGATFMVGNFRERALGNSERELENTVLLLCPPFRSAARGFRRRPEGPDRLSCDRAGSTARALQAPDVQPGPPPDASKSKMNALSYVGGVNVFDADGVLINSSAAWPVPAVSVADRPYFKTFKNDPQSPDMLIEPVYSRITGVWTTVIARKVTGPRGEFLGAIGSGIEPANFEKFFASLALGDGAAISMFHRDGTLLARYPHIGIDDRAEFRRRSVLPEHPFEIRSRNLAYGQSRRWKRPAGCGSRAEQVSDHRSGDDDGFGRAGRLARPDPVPDRGGRPLDAGDHGHAVSGGPQAVASAPPLRAAADGWKSNVWIPPSTT